MSLAEKIIRITIGILVLIGSITSIVYYFKSFRISFKTTKTSNCEKEKSGKFFKIATILLVTTYLVMWITFHTFAPDSFN